jgi:UDP-2,4-diacetamido-2,4,6-trideoxy-beta-L-altropyranose hydrolase
VKIAFRADAGPLIGSGHLARCITLATALADVGAEITFFCRHLPPSLEFQLQSLGFALHWLNAKDPDLGPLQGYASWLGVSPETDSAETLAALAVQGYWDWLIVDHYALAKSWQTPLRSAVRRICVIDDLADRQHDCDLLLDQNEYADKAERYLDLVPPAAEQLLGANFVLLRAEFSKLHDEVRQRDGSVKNILVFLGGGDAENITGVVLSALEMIDLRGVGVDVVIGAIHPAVSSIVEICVSKGYKCHIQTPNMAHLMAKADLAIGAGGTATWERCALGLPTLALCLAENQEKLLVDASRAGVLHAPTLDARDSAGIARHLSAMIDSVGWRNCLSNRAHSAVDGRGTERVLQRLLMGDLTVREVVAADSANLFAWRNHPAIRSVSRSTGEIAWQDHEKWFLACLADPSRVLLLGMENSRPIGVVRFDCEPTAAEVSIYLVPGESGRGVGRKLLRAAECWLVTNRPAIRSLVATVLNDNSASHGLFRASGYKINITSYEKRVSNERD